MSFGRVFHINGAAKEDERFPISSLTDGLKRVTTDVERVDLWFGWYGKESPKIERFVVL